MAVGQGFEPWVPLDTLVFKTSAFDHSATPPTCFAGNNPSKNVTAIIAAGFEAATLIAFSN